jgi:hypothetical protein
MVIYIKPRMTYKGNMKKRHAQMDRNLQKQMAFNEKLQKFLEEARRVKPFNYNNVFIENNEFKKHNTLL